jgi:seryl-tRNA synthetase
METKDQLVKTIKEWVKLDNEIRSLQKESNSRKLEKKKISETLIEIMKKNEIDCFDIKDGQICYSKKNIKQPITKKVLLSILTKYFSGETDKANELNEFILENRQEIVSESIVLKPLTKL